MLRDKAALRRESFITVLYFGLLIFLHITSPTYVPPIAPGHIVNPLFTFTSLSDPLPDQDTSPLITEYYNGRTHIAVAPCLEQSLDTNKVTDATKVW